MSRSFLFGLVLTIVGAWTPSVAQFPDYRENDKPASWTGRVFKLSQDYSRYSL